MSTIPKVAVVGAGMVGASIALALAQQNFDVTLFEFSQQSPELPPLHPHVRVSAFSHASIQWLKDIGAWPYIDEARLRDYRYLETWESGAAKVSFDAQNIQLSRLGVMAENNNVQQGIWRAMLALNVDFQRGVGVSERSNANGERKLILTNGKELDADLIIAADGGNSRLRQLSNIPVTGWNYAQHCLIITVEMLAPSEPEMQSTWQLFTSSGPRAFLPLYDNYASLVWYDSPEKIRSLMALSPEQLHNAIIEIFPERLSECRVLDFASFPLTRNHADTYFSGNVALVGDAAHTINPLAGQGVNIGFKDAKSLVDLLTTSGAEIPVILKRYERERRGANLLMSGAMDLFYAGFSNEHVLVKPIRSLALFAASRSGGLKDQVLKYAIGLS